MSTILDMNHVYKDFYSLDEERQILKDINFSVEEGEILVLLAEKCRFTAKLQARTHIASFKKYVLRQILGNGRKPLRIFVIMQSRHTQLRQNAKLTRRKRKDH